MKIAPKRPKKFENVNKHAKGSKTFKNVRNESKAKFKFKADLKAKAFKVNVVKKCQFVDPGIIPMMHPLNKNP